MEAAEQRPPQPGAWLPPPADEAGAESGAAELMRRVRRGRAAEERWEGAEAEAARAARAVERGERGEAGAVAELAAPASPDAAFQLGFRRRRSLSWPEESFLVAWQEAGATRRRCVAVLIAM